MGLCISKKAIETPKRLDPPLPRKRQSFLQYVVDDAWKNIHSHLMYGHMSASFDSLTLRNIISNENQKEILDAIITAINEKHFKNDKIELAQIIPHSSSRCVSYVMKMKESRPPNYDDPSQGFLTVTGPVGSVRKDLYIGGQPKDDINHDVIVTGDINHGVIVSGGASVVNDIYCRSSSF